MGESRFEVLAVGFFASHVAPLSLSPVVCPQLPAPVLSPLILSPYISTIMEAEKGDAAPSLWRTVSSFWGMPEEKMSKVKDSFV
jgi:hypothetical protein